MTRDNLGVGVASGKMGMALETTVNIQFIIVIGKKCGNPAQTHNLEEDDTKLKHCY